MIGPMAVSANLLPGLEIGEEAEQPGGSVNKSSVLFPYFFFIKKKSKMNIVMPNTIQQVSKKTKQALCMRQNKSIIYLSLKKWKQADEASVTHQTYRFFCFRLSQELPTTSVPIVLFRKMISVWLSAIPHLQSASPQGWSQEARLVIDRIED